MTEPHHRAIPPIPAVHVFRIRPAITASAKTIPIRVIHVPNAILNTKNASTTNAKPNVHRMIHARHAPTKKFALTKYVSPKPKPRAILHATKAKPASMADVQYVLGRTAFSNRTMATSSAIRMMNVATISAVTKANARISIPLPAIQLVQTDKSASMAHARTTRYCGRCAVRAVTAASANVSLT